MFVPRRSRTTYYRARPSTGSGVLQTTVRRKTRYPRKKYPVRLQPSRQNYNMAVAVSKALSRVAETKVLAMTKFNEVNPTPIQLGAQAYTTSYTIGSIPTIWSGITGINSLTNFQFPQGDGASDRDGDSIFLKKSHFSIELDMNQNLPQRSVVEFRVIAFKPNRATDPVGITRNWGLGLFLDTDGNYFGHQTAGISGTDLMLQPINRRHYFVMSDRKFTLSPSADLAQALPSKFTGVNPISRTMLFNCPFNKKVHFEGANTPQNIDPHMCVVIYARPIGRDAVADVWETNVRGTTSFQDA